MRLTVGVLFFIVIINFVLEKKTDTFNLVIKMNNIAKIRKYCDIIYFDYDVKCVDFLF